MEQSYFQKYVKYKRKYLLLLQTGGSVSSDTFDDRLEKSKICVIGAGYGNRDTERWGEVDPNYIGITGKPELEGNIPGNPIKAFNWNNHPTWVGDIFIKSFKQKSFDTLYIDKGTLMAHMRPCVVNNLFRLLSLWIKRGRFSIGKVMIPKMDVTFTTKLPDIKSYEHLEEITKKKIMVAHEEKIKRHEEYSNSIYEYLERVNDEVIIVAGVEFIEHHFKK